MSTNRMANFIIAGTDKAGTTSIFVYLSQHAEVCASSEKETNFFRREFAADESDCVSEYAQYFELCTDNTPILTEASPAYLREADSVVPRMHDLVPDVKLLFILREPVARLYSSYNFHVGRLNIPEDLSFSQYVADCLQFERQQACHNGADLDDWYLKVLGSGCYARYLKTYAGSFPASNIKVMFFEELQDDPKKFMGDLSDFLSIDREFWSDFDFRKENVTFSARNPLLQKIALRVNSAAEKTLRRRPGLKRGLVNLYKKINQKREGYEQMPLAIEQELQDFYASANRELSEMLGRELPPTWSRSQS